MILLFLSRIKKKKEENHLPFWCVFYYFFLLFYSWNEIKILFFFLLSVSQRSKFNLLFLLLLAIKIKAPLIFFFKIEFKANCFYSVKGINFLNQPVLIVALFVISVNLYDSKNFWPMVWFLLGPHQNWLIKSKFWIFLKAK